MSKQIKVKLRKEIATNKVFTLYFDAIEDKENNVNEDSYLVIETHSSLEEFTGVSILPVVGDSVLLINVYRHAIQKEIFEVPRGFVEKDDKNLKSSALRELREETNFDCRVANMVFMHGMYPEPGILKAKIALFIAKNCFKSNKNILTRKEFGHKSYKLFSRSDIKKMILTPENFDTTTFILLTHWFQNS